MAMSASRRGRRQPVLAGRANPQRGRARPHWTRVRFQLATSRPSTQICLTFAIKQRDHMMPLVDEHRAGRVVGKVLEALRIDVHPQLVGRSRVHVRVDEGAAVAQIETERTVFVDEQTETASVAADRTGVKIAWRPVVRQRRIQTSSVSSCMSAAASSGLSTSRYEPGWIG